MKQTDIDFEKLATLLDSRKKESAESIDNNRLVADKVKNRMHKVAFDVYRVDNEPYDSLWRLEANADDGKEYLVRMEDKDIATVKAASVWTALSNENGTNVTLCYKRAPLQKLSGAMFGFSKDDVGLFKKALIEKIATDTSFRNKVLDMLSDEKRAEITKIFPELIETR